MSDDHVTRFENAIERSLDREEVEVERQGEAVYKCPCGICNEKRRADKAEAQLAQVERQVTLRNQMLRRIADVLDNGETPDVLSSRRIRALADQGASWPDDDSEKM